MIAYLDYFSRFPGTEAPPDQLVEKAERLSIEITSVAEIFRLTP